MIEGELEYTKQVVHNAHHPLTEVWPVPKQWPLANFLPSLYSEHSCNSRPSRVEVGFPPVLSEFMQIKPQGDPWCVVTLFYLLSRVLIAEILVHSGGEWNIWIAGTHGTVFWAVSPQLRHRSIMRQRYFLHIARADSQFTCCLFLSVSLGHYWQRVGIRWCWALCKLPHMPFSIFLGDIQQLSWRGVFP